MDNMEEYKIIGVNWNAVKPDMASIGDVYYDTNSMRIMIYDGAEWHQLEAAKNQYNISDIRLSKLKNLGFGD
jgi:hypothetical protein